MRGFGDRLGERRVRMDAAGERLQGRLVLQRHHRLGDEVGGPGADDVDAQDLAVALLGDDLHEAGEVAQDVRLAVRGEAEAAHPQRVPGGGRGLLGEPHGTHFGDRVGGRRDPVGAHRAPLRAGDGGDRGLRFRRGGVRQLGAPHHIADGEDPRRRRPPVLVHLQEAAGPRLEADGVQPQVARARRPAHGHQQPVELCFPHFPRFPRVPDPVAEADAGLDDFRGLHPGVHPHRDAPLAEGGVDRGGDLLVLERQHPRKRLEERHLRAETAEHGGELRPDRPGADDAEPLRALRQAEHLGVRHHPVAVRRQEGERARGGAGGDDEVPRAEAPRLAGGRRHFDPSGPGETPVPLDRFHPGPAQQEGDAAGHLPDDAAVPLAEPLPVEFRRRHPDAVGLRRPDGVEQFRGVEEHLAGDAPHMEAGAPESLVLLDERGAESGRRRPEGRYIAARPAADDDDLVVAGASAGRFAGPPGGTVFGRRVGHGFRWIVGRGANVTPGPRGRTGLSGSLRGGPPGPSSGAPPGESRQPVPIPLRGFDRRRRAAD